MYRQKSGSLEGFSTVYAVFLNSAHAFCNGVFPLARVGETKAKCSMEVQIDRGRMIVVNVIFHLAALFQRKVEEKTPLLLREKYTEDRQRPLACKYACLSLECQISFKAFSRVFSVPTQCKTIPQIKITK